MVTSKLRSVILASSLLMPVVGLSAPVYAATTMYQASTNTAKTYENRAHISPKDYYAEYNRSHHCYGAPGYAFGFGDTCGK